MTAHAQAGYEASRAQAGRAQAGRPHGRVTGAPRRGRER
jgi:hypothetical protein